MTPQNDVRKFSIIFILCLAVVGGLVITGYFVTDRIIVSGSVSTKVARLGEQQRTLAARVISGAVGYAHGNDENARDQARGAMLALKATHNALTQGDPEAGIPEPDSPDIDTINFDAPYFLDEKLRRFLYAANEIVRRPWSEDLPRTRYIQELYGDAGKELVAGLEALAERHETEHTANVETMRTAIASIAGSILIVLLVIGGAIFLPMLRRLSRQTQELIDLARTDPLTGCHNRRSFLGLGEAEMDRFRRYEGDLSVIMLDIDKFKAVNDTFGHAVGDEVIRALARSCLENLRKSDILGRLGGEEFAVFLPETPIDKAMLVAEKIRIALSETAVAHPAGVLHFTTSFGVTTANKDDEDILSGLNRADGNLYAAKESGRNRVIGPDGATVPPPAP
jgi:diguanylate cyclase (GGDEF)-like protein